MLRSPPALCPGVHASPLADAVQSIEQTPTANAGVPISAAIHLPGAE